MNTEAMHVNEDPPRHVAAVEAQNVPPGCKHTDVGLIGEDWELVRLHRISDFITKGSTPTTYGFKWESFGILFLRSECVSPHGLDLDQSMFISPAAHAMLRRSEVRDGDLLMTITGNVGRVVLLRDVGVANINQHIARIRISARTADAGYVSHFLSQAAVRQRFESITTGQAYPQISLQQVREAAVPLPPLPEQRTIAEALSDADGLLGALEALIAKKRAIKQAAMQQLLTGKMRLPGFSGEWETKLLADVCTLKSGEAITSEGIDDHSPYPCYGGNGLRGFTGTFTHDGDFALIGRQGALCGNVIGVRGKFYASEHALVVTPRPSTDIHWLTFLLGDMNLNRYSESSAQPGLSAKKLLALKIWCPPTEEEQAEISAVLSEMDGEISALEARRDKTRAIKQGMMQQLLTGRVRLMKPAPAEGGT